jgi:hypothetical protein
VRLEGSTYSGAPARNADVEQAFGLRTDRFPSELRASPRVGFTYTHFPDTATRAGGDRAPGPARRARRRAGALPRRPTLFVRGGVGEFRGRAPTSLFSAAQQGSGVAGDERQLVCVGPQVPVVDYGAVLADGPSAIPTQCAPVAGVPPELRNSAPSVTAFAGDFRAPRSWRASLGVTRRFWERFTFGVEGAYAWGVAQYGVRDVNLDARPEFALADEGGRPVYVPAAADHPGQRREQPRRLARRPALLAGVRGELAPALAERAARHLAQRLHEQGIALNLSWTLARNRDESSFAFGAPAFGFQQTPTAGDPNVLALAAADQDVRHNLIATVTYPLNPSLELTLVGRATSGAPYTPVVQNDINGDGARNDRAFVFDPADAAVRAARPAVAAGMDRLLAEAPRRRASACARSSAPSRDATAAAARGCRAWTSSSTTSPTASASSAASRSRAVRQPARGARPRVQRRERAARVGPAGAPRPEPARRARLRRGHGTLRVRGERALRHDAQRAGLPADVPARLPGALRLRPGRRLLRGFGGGGAGRRLRRAGGGGPGGPGGRRGRRPSPRCSAAPPGSDGAAAAAAANPVAQIIELRDSLGLDSATVAKLEPVRDSLAERNRRWATDARAAIQKLGNNPDQATVFAAIRPRLAERVAFLQQALRESEVILGAERWAKVPEDVRNPLRRFFGGPGGGQGGGRPPRD